MNLSTDCARRAKEPGPDSHRPIIVCADSDAHGQILEVFWDYELDRLILEEEGWADLAIKASTSRGISQHLCIGGGGTA
jgi:hypothetical protein